MKRKSQFDRTPAMKWAVLLAVLVFAVFAIAITYAFFRTFELRNSG